jgi:quercetin dioxygenase-like cupin family protein
VVFYVLEGSGVWHEEAKEAITLKPGDSLHVRPGMIHAHRDARAGLFCCLELRRFPLAKKLVDREVAREIQIVLRRGGL